MKDYDYASAGEYFITICTYNRECLFGAVVNEEMQLSSIGKIVWEEWEKTPAIRSNVSLHVFVIMPNHIHGIIIIQDDSGIQKRSTVGTHGGASLQRQPRSLGSIIAGFKLAATKRVNERRNTPRAPLWQPIFYDRIIRGEKELSNIRDYILNNPLQWYCDEENPDRDGSIRIEPLP